MKTPGDISDGPPDKSDYNLNDLVCYCFGYTVDDIEQDLIKNGQSSIIAKITQEKRTAGCDCANKNPKGR